MATRNRGINLLSTAPVVAAVIVGALGALPARTQAADGQPGAMYVCRAAIDGENGNAQMTSGAGTTLVCRQVSATLKMSSGALKTIGRVTATSSNGPDLSNAITPGQINDAWVKYFAETFHIVSSP